MIKFSYPYFFLLLPLPLVLRKLLPDYSENTSAVRTPFFDDFAALVDTHHYRLFAANPKMQMVLFTLCWLLLISAFARPQYIEPPILKTAPSRDLLLAVDLSGSMETKDFTNSEGKVVNRLDAVREVLQEFLLHRVGDRVGLIFFGTAPFVQVPFTEDLEICSFLLDEAQVGMAGPQTMLGDTMGLAITIFEQSEVDERLLILLTDGNDTGSSIPPEEAAKIAQDKAITIHTIAVGDPEAAGEAPLDEHTLKNIAERTGGRYFHAGDRDELNTIYKKLDELDTREAETISYQPKYDLFYWPLAILMALSFFYHGFLALKSVIRARNEGRP